MSKQDLVRELAETTGITQTEARKVLAALPLLLKRELLTAGKVAIPGVGIAKIADRAARTARNPVTGEKIAVPAKKVVKIKTGKEFGQL